MRTPPLLHLGLHNSLSERGAGGVAAASARITLFSPYWLNNRTGEAASWTLCSAAASAGVPPPQLLSWVPPANRWSCCGCAAPRCTPPAGVDLFYQDRLSAPGQPFLFGAALPWDYGEVFTPGGGGACPCTAGWHGSLAGWPALVAPHSAGTLEPADHC